MEFDITHLYTGFDITCDDLWNLVKEKVKQGYQAPLWAVLVKYPADANIVITDSVGRISEDMVNKIARAIENAVSIGDLDKELEKIAKELNVDITEIVEYDIAFIVTPSL